MRQNKLDRCGQGVFVTRKIKYITSYDSRTTVVRVDTCEHREVTEEVLSDAASTKAWCVQIYSGY